MSEPLLAAVPDRGWMQGWSSEAPEYGGLGIPALPPALHGWCMPGGSAVVLLPTALEHRPGEEGSNE
jgi:hypothetical protein